MGRVRLTDTLLRSAHRAAARHVWLNQQLTKAFQARYGCTYSDVDCDDLIDALDYGAGSEPTLESCDAAMSKSGCEVITAKVKLTEAQERTLRILPDEWGPWPPDAKPLLALCRRGLAEKEYYPSPKSELRARCRRTDSGRAFLPSSGKTGE